MSRQRLLTRRDALILALLAAAGILLWLFLRTGGTAHVTARITVDGACIGEYDLTDSVQGTFTLPQAEGVVFEIGEQGIRICENDCASRQCAHTGWISRPHQTIVCLPKKLMIELTVPEASAPDAII